MAPQPRPGIAALAPYPLAEAPDPAAGRVINLASNENAERPSAVVLEACQAAALEAHRYPEASAAGLREALGATYDLDPARIVCANGSSELISILAQTYLGEGDEAVVGRHGYLFFGTATRIAGARPVAANAPRLSFDPEALLAAVTPRTRIVFLDNPSNPLGTALKAEQVADLRQRLPEDVLLVLDAAYADYVTDDGYDAGAALVDHQDNVVMLRTFSKIYGLAGLRVGWAYAPPDIADVLHRARQPNNLASVSIAGATAALAEQDVVLDRRKANARVRDAFADRLREDLGFEVVPSQTNFLLARPPDGAPLDAVGLAASLHRQGILVRPMAPYDLPEWLRVTVGTAEEMATVFRSVERCFA